MVNRFKLIVAIAFMVFISACNGSSTGIGQKPTSARRVSEVSTGCKDGIDVYLIDYEEAMRLATVAMRRAYPLVDVNIDYFSSYIQIINRNKWFGDVKFTVEPKLVVEKNSTENTGMTYDMKYESFGINGSMAPNYVTTEFLKNLKIAAEEKSVKVARFCEYEILKDKGIAVFAPGYIPTTTAGFKSYLLQKTTKKYLEGIWTTIDNKFTLGMFFDQNDPMNHYKAVILESKATYWKPGEIKVLFNDLSLGQTAIGSWFMENKYAYRTTWEVKKDIISSLTKDPMIALVKIFPVAQEGFNDFVSKSGTSWAVTDDCIYVTNAHVVDGANKIYLGHKDGEKTEARLLIADKRIDIALIQPITKSVCTPLPMLGDGEIVQNGEDIFTLGYPLAFDLGSEAKISRGIVSSQTGINNDVTRYQITAQVNPGNSGGPTLNRFGEVIGIVVEKISGAEGVNFSIKSEYLRTLLNQVGVKPKYGTEKSETSASAIYSKYKGSVMPVWTEM